MQSVGAGSGRGGGREANPRLQGAAPPRSPAGRAKAAWPKQWSTSLGLDGSSWHEPLSELCRVSSSALNTKPDVQGTGVTTQKQALCDATASPALPPHAHTHQVPLCPARWPAWHLSPMDARHCAVSCSLQEPRLTGTGGYQLCRASSRDVQQAVTCWKHPKKRFRVCSHSRCFLESVVTQKNELGAPSSIRHSARIVPLV